MQAQNWAGKTPNSMVPYLMLGDMVKVQRQQEIV